MSQIAGTTAADVYPELREWFANQPVPNTWATNHPFWSLLTKDENCGGSDYPQPINLGGSLPYSAFVTAQNNQVPVNPKKFAVPYQENYVLSTVSTKVALQSRTTQGAYADVVKQSVESAMLNATQMDAAYVFRSGTGALATIKNTAISNGIIYLNNPADGKLFSQGYVLVASSTDGGGTVRAGVGYVLAVDPIAGIIQVSATGQGGAPGTPSGWSTNSNTTFGDYLYPQSNMNAQMNGLAGWFPSATSTRRPVVGTANIFCGVDRSVAPVDTAGVALDLSGQDVLGGLTDLVSAVKDVGKGQPDYVFVNTVSFRSAVKKLQQQRAYDASYAETKSTAGITFRGIMVEDAMVLADPMCPQKIAYALDMSTIKMVSMLQNPGFIQYPDGLLYSRTANNDATEARLGGFRNLTCSNPRSNGVGNLSI